MDRATVPTGGPWIFQKIALTAPQKLIQSAFLMEQVAFLDMIWEGRLIKNTENKILLSMTEQALSHLFRCTQM